MWLRLPSFKKMLGTQVPFFQICSTKLSWCRDQLSVIGRWSKIPYTMQWNWPLASIAPFQGKRTKRRNCRFAQSVWKSNKTVSFLNDIERLQEYIWVATSVSILIMRHFWWFCNTVEYSVKLWHFFPFPKTRTMLVNGDRDKIKMWPIPWVTGIRNHGMG